MYISTREACETYANIFSVHKQCRREQIAEITRLGQTLMHVKRLFWVVADDTDSCNPTLDKLLENFGEHQFYCWDVGQPTGSDRDRLTFTLLICALIHSLTFVSSPFILLGIPFVHLSSPMPYAYRAETSHKTVPRGVANRRAALNWIKSNKIQNGVLYFGDDDNTFDLRLFDEIRSTQKVSMFPVGLIGEYSVSAPVVKDVSGKFSTNAVQDQHIHSSNVIEIYYSI